MEDELTHEARAFRQKWVGKAKKLCYKGKLPIVRFAEGVRLAFSDIRATPGFEDRSSSSYAPEASYTNEMQHFERADLPGYEGNMSRFEARDEQGRVLGAIWVSQNVETEPVELAPDESLGQS